MGLLKGKDCKVMYNGVTVASMGTWKLDGIKADEIDTSAFGQNWKSFCYGMKDGGTITFSGFRDPDDATGQNALQMANVLNTPITNIKFYMGSTRHYEPNQTTGYWSPDTAYSAGQDTTPGVVYITAFNVSADKSGMVLTDFTARVANGPLVLVNG